MSPAITLRSGVESLGLDESCDEGYKLAETLANGDLLKISDIANFYGKHLLTASLTYRTKAPKRYLEHLQTLHLVKSVQQRKGGTLHWDISKLTLKKLIDACGGHRNNFEDRFYSALEFYADYYLFGEVGTFLLDRAEEKRRRNPFRSSTTISCSQ